MITEVFDDAVPVDPAMFASEEYSVLSLVPLEYQVGVYITTGGTLEVQMAAGPVRTFEITDGQMFKGRITYILPGTTCSGIYILMRGA